MTLLFRNRQASFTWVRDALELTDGNLGSHAEKLAQSGYLAQGKALTPAGFQVRLRITPEGDEAFRQYLLALRGYLEAEGPRELAPNG